MLLESLKKGGFLSLLAGLCLWITVASAAPLSGSAGLQVIPITDLKPGMEGEGRTVFSGDKIETFKLKVIDVLHGMGPSGGDLILFRGLSDNLRNNHGVSQGMSGSPIYFKGKLAGAVSLAFASGDPMVGGATPIGEMLDALSASQNHKPLSTSYVIPGYGRARLAASPVFVAGGSPRAQQRLQDDLNTWGHQVMVLGGAPAAANEETRVLEDVPQPGSMIVVGLLQGDVSVFTAGTLTAVLEDRVVAFGHSFKRVGPVSLVLGKGLVSHVMKHREVAYKVVKPAGVYGRMDEDRGVAMVGTLMRFVPLADILVRVDDRTQGVVREGHFQAVTDEKFSLEVTRTALLSALDKTLDRIGKGTSQVSFSIRLKGREKPIERANTFYNPVDVAAESIREADGLLRFFQFNEFQEVALEALSFSVTLSDADNTMNVRKVVLLSAGERSGVLTGVTDGGKTLILKKSVGGPAPKQSGEGKAKPQAKEEPAEDEDSDDKKKEDDKDTRAGGGDEKSRDGKPGQDPHLTVRPGQSVTVDVTLLPFRQKPVQKSFRVKLDRQTYPPGDYNFTVGGYEPPGEGDEQGKEPPLNFEEAIRELDDISPGDQLILECRSILVRDPPKKNGKDPDKKALRQVMKVNGFAVTGKKNFRITVKSHAVTKDKPGGDSSRLQKSAPRKSRLDPPGKR